MSAPWEQDEVVVAGPRTVNGVGDAWTAGYQSSLAGLIDRNALPDVVLDPQHSKWYERAVAMTAQMVNEGPEMLAGAVGGGAAGSLVAPGVGTAVGAGAGAFAVPTAIRSAYTHALKTGQITSSSSFLDRTRIALKSLAEPDVLLDTGKSAVVGGVTGGVGKVAEPLIAGAMATKVAAGTVAPATARAITDVGKLAAEGTAMVVTPAALEGRLPEPQEFLDAAVMLGGLKASTYAGRKLVNIYEQTGKTPIEVVADAKQDPVLREELASSKPETVDAIPKAYRELAAETRAKDIVPPESVEAAQAFIERPFSKIPQAPGEPVLKTHVNYNYIDSPEAAKMTLARLSEMYESKIVEQTRGTVPWEQTYAEAKKLYEDVTGEKAPQAELGASYPKLAADLFARKQLLISGAEQLMTMREAYSKARDTGTATEVMKLELAAMMDKVGMSLAETRGAQAEVGRALNILKSTNRDKAYYDQLNDVINGRFKVDGKDVGGAKFDTMVDMMGDLGTPQQALKFAENAAKATTWQKVVEGWKSALVSGPITQLANIIGNVTFAATRPLVDSVAVAFNKAGSSKERMSAAEPLARVMGNVNGVIDGAKVALAVLKTGESPILNEVQRPKAIEGKLGEAIRTPFRLLGAADAFFRTVAERGEAYTLATRQAAKEGFNPSTHEFRERVAQIVNNLDENQLKQVEEAGVRFTFNAPLGEAGRSIQTAVRNTHTEWMVPFIQTPANVLKEMIRLTPAAPILSEWRADLAAGGVRASKAAAEIAVGTAVSVTFFSLARSGMITGQGDPDPRKRAAQMASGWQPYSVKIGDTWYSYQRLQPVGTLIGMAADAAAVYDNMSEEEGDKAVKITATAFANAITNQTFLQGLTQVINATSDPDRYGAKLVENMAGSAVPGIIGQTNQMIDPYKREVDSVLDAVQSRIPGLSQGLRPKRDIFGEPIANTDRVGGVLPVAESTQSTDKVRLEVARLKEGVGKAPKYIELPAGRDPKLGRLDLTGAQQDTFAKEAGKFAYGTLAEIINDPSWDELSDMEQRGIIKRVFEVTRKVGRYSAVTDQQLEEKIQKIEAELNKRSQPK